MRPIARVAHASRVLVKVFHRHELSENSPVRLAISRSGKLVALEYRDQRTRRVRYPELA